MSRIMSTLWVEIGLKQGNCVAWQKKFIPPPAPPRIGGEPKEFCNDYFPYNPPPKPVLS